MNTAEPKQVFSAWIPLSLLALTLIAVLSMNLTSAMAQRNAALQIQGQYQVQMAQASETERRMKLLMTDLLTLALTDTNAAAIVNKYRISMNQPTPPSPPAASPEQP